MQLSVIIPTRNRGVMVANLLDSLAALDSTELEWEVVVVDNASTDNTVELVQKKQNELSIHIRYVLEERPGLHEGRNRGVKEARGDYIAYLDDDMLLVHSWLQGVSMLINGKADAVVGRVLPKWEDTPPLWLSRLHESGVFGLLALLDMGDAAVPTEHFFGCNIFLSKKDVYEYGGFHPDGMPEDKLQYRGDGETGFWLKMKANGKRLWYSPSAIAYHIIPLKRMTVAYLQTRSYNQGISASFTDIRLQYGLYGNVQSSCPQQLRRLRSWAKRQPPVAFLRYRFRCFQAKEEIDRKVAYIKYELAKSFMKGWAFHRKAMHDNPELRKWVARSNFLSR